MRVQQVRSSGGGPESWTVVDERFAVVDEVDEILAHLSAIKLSPGTVRSYAFDLRDQFEFLGSHGVDLAHGPSRTFGPIRRVASADAVGPGRRR
ncbi:hypothetical protein ACX9NE_20075 [Mycobacterium sp. ML4]